MKPVLVDAPLPFESGEPVEVWTVGSMISFLIVAALDFGLSGT